MDIHGYWTDWVLMSRLKCTWQELQDMPADVLNVFDAFMRGEDEAKKAASE